MRKIVLISISAAILFTIISCDTGGPGTSSDNIAPSAFAGENMVVLLQEEVEFSGMGTDEDGFIVKYEWDFDGDGTIDDDSSTPKIFTFIYTDAGIYIALFRVTDDRGATGEDSVEVHAGLPTPGEWEDEPTPLSVDELSDPNVFYYNSKYNLFCYDENGERYYFESEDGVNWSWSSTPPILFPPGMEESRDFEIHYQDPGYILVFSSAGEIYFTTSADGLTWSAIESPDIPYDNQFSENGVKNPTLALSDTYYNLWFTDIEETGVGYAYRNRAQSEDQQWQITSPAVLTSEDTGVDRINRCKVLYDGKFFKLWYETSSGDHYNLQYLESENPREWSNSSVVITIGENGIPDSLDIDLNSIVFDHNDYKYLLYYTIHEGESSRIGIAKSTDFKNDHGNDQDSDGDHHPH